MKKSLPIRENILMETRKQSAAKQLSGFHLNGEVTP